MLAPIRANSGTCINRFSKIVSVTIAAPFATVINAMNCAWRSVGNPGYGSVIASTPATRPFIAMTRMPASVGSIEIPAAFITSTKLPICVRSALKSSTSPPVMAAAAANVPVSIRSGNTECTAPCSASISVDRNRVGPDAFDLRAHCLQAMTKVLHFRFARRVQQCGAAFRKRRRHHEIFGRADGNKWKDHLTADEPIRRARLDISAVEFDLSAEFLQPLEVQINVACRWRNRPAARPAPHRSAQ